MNFSFKNKNKDIKINIELDDETLEDVIVSPLTLKASTILEDELLNPYYERLILNMLRKNENAEEISDKLVNNLTATEIATLIKQASDEIMGKLKD